MRIENVMILWNPTLNDRPGGVKVVEYPDAAGRLQNDRGYAMATGACHANWRTMTDEQRVAELFKFFHQLVIRDGVNIWDVHNAFSQIDEFADALVDCAYSFNKETLVLGYDGERDGAAL